MPKSDEAPQRLSYEHGPSIAEDPFWRIMFRHQQELVPRNPAHGVGMPAAECGAALVVGHGFGDVNAVKARGRAADSEIDVFEVRLELFVQESHAFEQFSAEQRGRERCELDFALPAPQRLVLPPVTTAPRTTAPAHRVERSIDSVALQRIEQ